MSEPAPALASFPFLGLSERMRCAIKVAISLTLAFMIPMALGLPQASTAAVTIMIIAASGDMRDSLMKGTLRLIGTVLGAAIGLTLIALFAQDRLLYLLSASAVVTCLLYLASVYRGDGTIFTLAAVVTLLVFNGGQVENAFQYGIDRAFMTVFGVALYTLVGSTLWPLKSEPRLEDDARHWLALNRDLVAALREGGDREATATLMDRIHGAEQTLATTWQAARSQYDDVAAYRREWQHLQETHRSVSRELNTLLEPPARPPLDYGDFIHGHDEALAHLAQQLDAATAAWQGQAVAVPPAPTLQWRTEALRRAPHLTRARVAARVAALDRLGTLSAQLRDLARCLASRGPNLQLPPPPPAAASFRWLDPESLKLAARVFIGFWLASAIWIGINPPGGFMLVVFTVLLLPMVSFTPLSPTLLYLLFGLGFLFAVPCYVLLLPALSRGYELAAFIFCYAWVGHYLFKGPITLFFMLGLMTLGIDNTMHYNMAVILNLMLMFALAITALTFLNHFVFSSKPERLFDLMRRRFFRHAAALASLRTAPGGARQGARWQHHAGAMEEAAARMKLWAGRIDTGYFRGSSRQQLLTFAGRCEALGYQLGSLADPPPAALAPGLTAAMRRRFAQDALPTCLGLLGARCPDAGTHRAFVAAAPSASAVEAALDAVFDRADTEAPTQEHIAILYVRLNQLSLLWLAVTRCEQALREVDWRDLAQGRF